MDYSGRSINDSIMPRGMDPFLATPENDNRRLRFSAANSPLPSILSTASPAQARKALESHLAETERRLQDASRLGTILVQQRQELTSQLEDLSTLDDGSELDPVLKQKLVELEREFTEVGRDTARSFVPRNRIASNHDAILSDPTATPIIFSSTTAFSPTKFAGPLSRKQRNLTPGRVNDIKLATEISTSLLNQVRELQAALSEKDDALRAVLEERNRLELEKQNLSQRVRALDESEQRYKDENWALETRLNEQQTSHLQLIEKEKRLHQTLNQIEIEKMATERELEDLKQVHTRAADDHSTYKKMHDLELATLRRGVTSADAERSALHKRIDDLVGQNQELAQAMAYRMRSDKAEADADRGSDDDHDAAANVTPDASPPVSPAKGTPRHGHLESETLKSSLNHALRMIQNLKHQIHREKAEKVDLKRQLQDAQDEVDIRRNEVEHGQRSAKKAAGGKSLLAAASRRPNNATVRGGVKTDITVHDPEWEEWEDNTPSRVRPQDRPVSISDSSAFETARDLSGSDDDADQSMLNSTGIFSDGGDDGEMTETESATGLRRVNRSLIFRKARDNSPTASTSSVSSDELDDPNLALYTPARPNGNRYRHRSRMVSGRSVLTPSSSIAQMSSPMSVASPGSMASPQSINSHNGVTGQSLAAELDSFAFYREGSVAPSHGSTVNSPSMVMSPAPESINDVFRSKADNELGDRSVDDFSRTTILAGDSPFVTRPADGTVLSIAPVALPPVLLTMSEVHSVGALIPADSSVSIHLQKPTPRVFVSVGVQTDEVPAKVLEVSRTSSTFTPPEQAGVSIHEPKREQPCLVISDLSYLAIGPEDTNVKPHVEKIVLPLPIPLLIPDLADGDKDKSIEEAAGHNLGVAIVSFLESDSCPSGFITKVDLAPVKQAALSLSKTRVVEEKPALFGVVTNVSHCPALIPVPIPILVPEGSKDAPIAQLHVADVSALGGSPQSSGLSANVISLKRSAELTQATVQSQHGKPVTTSVMASQPVAPPQITPAASLLPSSDPTKKSVTLSMSSASGLSSKPVNGGGAVKHIGPIVVPILPISGYGDGDDFDTTSLPDDSPSNRHSSATIRPSDYSIYSSEITTPTIESGGMYRYPESSPVPVPPIPSPYRHAMQGRQPVVPASVPELDESKPRQGGRIPFQPISGNSRSNKEGNIRSIRNSRDENDDENRLFAPGLVNGTSHPPKQIAFAHAPALPHSSARKGRDLLAGAGAFRAGAPTESAGGRASPTMSLRTPVSPARSLASRHPTPGGPSGTAMVMGPPPPMPASLFAPVNRSVHIRPTTPGGTAGHRSGRNAANYTPGRSMRSEVSSPVTHRSSVSSFASELDTRFNIHPPIPQGFDPNTDSRMIQAITQTMIGEWLWKYTRKTGRSEMSASRHRRFFWVHPYTRTLYWSETDPSNAGRVQLKAKSVAIEAVRVVVDENPFPPGLFHKSLVIITPGRTIKFTAPTSQTHETWFNSLSYLLLRTAEERTGNEEDDDATELAIAPSTVAPSITTEHGDGTRVSSRAHGMARASFASLSSRVTGISTMTNRYRDREHRETPHKATARPTPYNTPIPHIHRVEKQSVTPGTAKSTLTTRSSTRFGNAIGTLLKKPSAIRGSLAGRYGNGTVGTNTNNSTITPANAHTHTHTHNNHNTQASLAAMDPASYEDSSSSGPARQATAIRNQKSMDDLQGIIAARERDVERLENVRACCDGKHDVGSLSRTSRYSNMTAKSSTAQLHGHGNHGNGDRGYANGSVSTAGYSTVTSTQRYDSQNLRP